MILPITYDDIDAAFDGIAAATVALYHAEAELSRLEIDKWERFRGLVSDAAFKAGRTVSENDAIVRVRFPEFMAEYDAANQLVEACSLQLSLAVERRRRIDRILELAKILSHGGFDDEEE